MAKPREFLTELPDGIALSPTRWYQRMVEDMLAHAHEWTQVTEQGVDPGDDSAVMTSGKASSIASSIRNRQIKAFAAAPDQGDFEAEKVQVTDDGYHLYARWCPLTEEDDDAGED